MPEQTPSEEIAGQIAGVITETLGKEGAERTGVVFGEEHTNNEFHQMLATQILPQAAKLAGNPPRNLFLEWDNTEDNLALIEEYNRTGDPAIRDHLVETNLDFANDEKERLVERDFKTVLDSARENGFTIKLYDEKGVSIDTFLNQVADEVGKPVIELSSEEVKQAGERRVAASNPAMIRNIDAGAEPGSFSVVLTGDNHANAPSDLNEALGFSYIRMREQGGIPDVKTNHDGADLDVSLVDYELNRHFLSQEINRIGIDFVSVVLDDMTKPSEWMSEGNRQAIGEVLDGMQQAGRLVAAGELQQAQQQLDESWGKLTERFTQDQINADSYLGSIVEIIDASKSVIWDEIDKAPAEPAPDVPENDGMGEPAPGGVIPGRKF